MRTLLVVAACACLGLPAFAQPWGTVVFANKVPAAAIDAPVLDGCGTRLLGPAYVAQLWAGPVGGTVLAVGDPIPFRTSTAAAGYWSGELRTIPGIRVGDDAVIEVRAWSVAAGKTWEEAWNSTNPDRRGNWGFSPQLIIRTGGAGEPPLQPADLVGLEGFRFVGCPEPTAWGLLFAGGSVLFLRLQLQRRKGG